MQLARIAEAFVLLTAVDVLAWHSTKALYRVLRVMARLSTPRHSSAAATYVEAITEASIWYFHPVACLQRSAALALMLRLNGIAAELVIGFQPTPFRSHAWVEVDGTIVNDRPQYQRVFTVLDRL
jgi:hypothetical protein